MGRADDAVAQNLIDVAVKQGFELPRPNPFDLRSLRPKDEVLDPMTPRTGIPTTDLRG